MHQLTCDFQSQCQCCTVDLCRSNRSQTAPSLPVLKRQGAKRQKSWQHQQSSAKSAPALESDVQDSAFRDPKTQHCRSVDFPPQQSLPQDSLHGASHTHHSDTQLVGSHHSDPHDLKQEPTQGVKLEEMCPPPMPVRVTPGSRPTTANGLSSSACHPPHHQHQHQQGQQQPINPEQLQQISRDLQQQEQQQQQDSLLQQAQQQHSLPQHGTPSDVDAAAQALERFQRSMEQQEVHAVPAALGGGGAVGLQGCLHRFVRPEMLCKWTCSRYGGMLMLL